MMLPCTVKLTGTSSATHHYACSTVKTKDGMGERGGDLWATRPDGLHQLVATYLHEGGRVRGWGGGWGRGGYT